MIAWIWRGQPSASADAYQRHYETEIGEQPPAVSGILGFACYARRIAKK
jgi:hypothetical protein